MSSEKTAVQSSRNYILVPTARVSSLVELQVRITKSNIQQLRGLQVKYFIIHHEGTIMKL